jgi:hypothetical protein
VVEIKDGHIERDDEWWIKDKQDKARNNITEEESLEATSNSYNSGRREGCGVISKKTWSINHHDNQTSSRGSLKGVNWHQKHEDIKQRKNIGSFLNQNKT